ncbi:MAG: PaaI family thioesterase [Acidimicrobiales bacterium]|jgi:acyl-CoA thioesterase|nr:PaaI family thioesterase [Acidimicrobiales bacterium]MEE1563764.1 PaaI family thioesterase [Acidimicrobiales bacterium]|tara:strand:- start:98 stop:430 length:333 start_codon:yes stop_codon:yes gene_type:complete
MVIPGRREARLDVGVDHLNPNDVVHGGVVFTLVDTAMGRATMSVLDEGLFRASIEVSVRFLRAVPAERLRARVQVLHAGRRIVHPDGRVFVDGEEKPVAAVSGSFAVLGG